ncbi:MAG: hypothetical protein IMX05_01330 [Hydrogenibacillus schlegelii]|nr:hypothetical protein [Hydrogenibacillus schlegelii]
MAAERFGRKRLFVTGIALMGAGYAASAVAFSLWGIIFVQLVAAVGMALLVTTEVQLLFRCAGTPELETRSYGWMFAVFHLKEGNAKRNQKQIP